MEILKYERYQFIGRQTQRWKADTTGHSNPVLKLKVNPRDASSNPSFVELAGLFSSRPRAGVREDAPLPTVAGQGSLFFSSLKPLSTQVEVVNTRQTLAPKIAVPMQRGGELGIVSVG